MQIVLLRKKHSFFKHAVQPERFYFYMHIPLNIIFGDRFDRKKVIEKQ